MNRFGEFYFTHRWACAILDGLNCDLFCTPPGRRRPSQVKVELFKVQLTCSCERNPMIKELGRLMIEACLNFAINCSSVLTSAAAEKLPQMREVHYQRGKKQMRGKLVFFAGNYSII